jgi:hypothetical protein
MKAIHRAARVLAPMLAVSLVVPNLLRAQEDADTGWTMLFDGKDVGGWEFYFRKAGADSRTITEAPAIAIAERGLRDRLGCVPTPAMPQADSERGFPFSTPDSRPGSQ